MTTQYDGTMPAPNNSIGNTPAGSEPRRRIGGSTYAPEVEISDADVELAAKLAATSGNSWSGTASAKPRKRRRRRHWYRRPFVMIPLVLALAVFAVAAYTIQRAESTVSVVQSISTPPPVVSLRTDDPLVNEDGKTVANTAVNVDTDPARQALQDSGVDAGGDGGSLGGIVDRASNVGSLGQGALAAAGIHDQHLSGLNVLLMGVDARPGEAIDVGVRPDVLAVLHLDPSTGDCRLLSIPRDSRVELPGYGLSKINHALAVGGVPYQKLVTEKFLDLKIDRYALIDFGGVVSVVDAVGGVKVNITETFTTGNVNFKPGPRTLTGKEALLYVRYRGGPDGDFGRIHRQQQVLRQLIRQSSSLGVKELVQTFLPVVKDHFRTDLSPAEMVGLGNRFRDSCTEESLAVATLDGTIATFDDPIFKLPLSYVVEKPAEVKRKVAELTADK